VCVAKHWDDLWLGGKGQSNPEIAGSLRNVFKHSSLPSPGEVEHFGDGRGPKPRGKSESGCKGPGSRGEEPRAVVKDPQCVLSAQQRIR